MSPYASRTLGTRWIVSCVLVAMGAVATAEPIPGLNDTDTNGNGTAEPTAVDEPSGNELGDDIVGPPDAPVRWSIEEPFLLVARAGTETRWSYRLAYPEAPVSVCGPVEWDARLYVATGAHLWSFDPLTGEVLSHVHLDGNCASIDATQSPPVLTTTRSDQDHTPWTRTHSLDRERGIATAPSYPSMNGVPLLQRERAARAEVETIEAMADGWPSSWPLLDERATSDLRAGMERLAARAELDRTDPWHLYHLAAAHEALGDPTAADRFLAQIEQTVPSIDWIRVAARLIERAPSLSDRLFDGGAAALESRGYDRETALFAVQVVLHLGRLPTYATASWETRDRVASRLDRIAPNAEGAWAFWNTHAKAARAAGNTDAEALARHRIATARPNRHLGGVTNAPLPINSRLHLLMTIVLGVPFLFFVHVGRVWRQRPWREGTGVLRWLPSAWLPRSFLVGCLAVGLLGAWTLDSLIRDVRLTGRFAEVPLDAVSGFAGHPTSTHWWDAMGPGVQATEWVQHANAAATSSPLAPSPGLHAILDAFRASARAPNPSIDAAEGAISLYLQLLESEVVTAAGLTGDLFVLVALFVLALCLIGLVVPRRSSRGTHESSRRWKIASWLIPGKSPRLGVVGPLLFVVVACALVHLYWYMETGELAWERLGAIAQPAMDRYYGLTHGG
jgi:hypothetical protein